MFTEDEVMTRIVPSIGVVVGTLMFLSPLKAVMDMRKNGRLGDLNPIPFPIVIANCVAWVAYAIVSKDPYVFLANDPGVLLGLFYTLSAYGYADVKTRNRLMALILLFGVALSGVALAVTSMAMSKNEKLLLWGITANVVLLIYYSAPLTTMREVIVTRSSASLYWPLCMMNVLNGSLWIAYGRATHNSFIWVPNAVGAALGLLQLSLCLAFRRKTRIDPEEAAKREPLLSRGAEDSSSRPSLLSQRRTSSADKLRVKPSELGKATLEAVTAEIQRTYIDKVLPKLGLVITLFDILDISEGFVFPSDGAVHFDTKFRLVVFKPFVGQVLLGQLKSCDSKGLRVDLGFFNDLLVPEYHFPAEYWFHSQDGLWVWKYEGNDMYLDLKEPIRVRVMEVKFNPVPTEVERQGDDSDAIPRGTEGNPFTPMEVIASVNDEDIPGLGLISWWEGVEEEAVEEETT